MHFICLDSMTADRSSTGAMATWLKNDLAATTRDWIISFWHHPPYTKGSHDSDAEIELIQMRENMLPILEQGGVDLNLTGHSHSYERSFLLDGHYGASDSLTAAMKKDGGSGRADGTGAYRKPAGLSSHQGAVYTVAGSSGQVSGGTLDHPAMFISLNVLGSVVLDLNGNRLDLTFLDSTAATQDYFTILKGAPAAPTNLTATAGNAQVSLSWTASAGAASYNVKRSTTNGGPYTTIATGVTTTSYTNTGLTNGTTYFYVVSAVNASGESPNSNQASATPTCSIPAAPTGLTATAGNAQVSLSWTASSGATSYNAKRSTTSGGPYTTIASVSATNFTDTTVTNGTTYFYVVSAVNTCGESANSAQVSATPQAATAPLAPTGLTASAVITGKNSKINLSWVQSTSVNVTQNKVYRSTTTGGPYAVIATINAATSYTDAKRTSGVTYFYVVTAVNSSGMESSFSNQASATAR